MIFMVIACIGLLLIFLAINHYCKYSLFNSLSFYLFLGSFMVLLTHLAFEKNNFVAMIISYVIFIIIVVMAVFGLYIAIGLLFLNAKIVRKKENSSIANSLTLFLGITLIIYAICSLLIFYFVNPDTTNLAWQIILSFWYAFDAVITIMFFYFILVITNILLVNTFIPTKDYQFLIILGAGLIDGNVGPLLASRINKAVKYYQRQQNNNKACYLIFSGGQGSDEPRSEALAMREYALSQGVKLADCYLEDKASTTSQNMLFSKAIIDAQGKLKYSAKVLFVTSNYHLYRAGLFARQVGLRIQGLGAKTAFYFLPNAVLREFLAVFWSHKKRNLILLSISFLLSLSFSLINFLYLK